MAVQESGFCAEVSTFLASIPFQHSGGLLLFSLLLQSFVGPNGTVFVVPFVGPDVIFQSTTVDVNCTYLAAVTAQGSV